MKKSAWVIIALAVGGHPALARETVYWGPHAGQTITVVSKTGLNSAHAAAHLRYTIQDAQGQCDGREGPDWRACVSAAWKEKPFRGSPSLRTTITADCRTGRFINAYGLKVRFAGRNPDPKSKYTYRLILEDGTDLPDPAHDMAVEIFRLLCPARAPLPAERYGYRSCMMAFEERFGSDHRGAKSPAVEIEHCLETYLSSRSREQCERSRAKFLALTKTDPSLAHAVLPASLSACETKPKSDEVYRPRN